MNIEVNNDAATSGLASGPRAPSQSGTSYMRKETWYCADCGSLDIRHDAIVSWDPEQQDWKVEATLDDTWCENCMGKDPMRESRGEPVWGIPDDSDTPETPEQTDAPETFTVRDAIHGTLEVTKLDPDDVVAEKRAAAPRNGEPLTIAYIGYGLCLARDQGVEFDFGHFGGEDGLMAFLIESAQALDDEWERRYGENGVCPHGAHFIFSFAIALPFGSRYAEMLAHDHLAKPDALIQELFNAADPEFREAATQDSRDDDPRTA